MRRSRVIGALLVTVGVVAATIAISRRGQVEARCGSGFSPHGARCEPEGCPAPLVSGPAGCDVPDTRIVIPAMTITIGPSDWEAEGRVPAREAKVAAFAIDAFELTRGKVESGGAAGGARARAAAQMTYREAEQHCRHRGGRLPTEDEWLAATATDRVMRYPWGDTGAVCRRAAWGLATGPCATAASGDLPDTVGAHADGATRRGIFDLAGNVAEWIAMPPGAELAQVRGGSWRTALASDLRTWAKREVDPETRADDIGVRCAYDIK